MKLLSADTAPIWLRPFFRRNIKETALRPLARIYLRFRARRSHAGIERLDGVLLLNLSRRTDRLEAFTQEAARIGLEFERFEAIAERPGIVGCTASHAAMLTLALDRGWQTAMILEDDARFLVSRSEIDVLVDAFLDDEEAEVACLAFHNQSLPRWRSFLYFRALHTQTTACYLVKRSMMKQLVELFAEAATQLRRGGHPTIWAVDQVWKTAQQDRVFLIPTIRAVTQAPGWSDIEERHVQYSV